MPSRVWCCSPRKNKRSSKTTRLPSKSPRPMRKIETRKSAAKALKHIVYIDDSGICQPARGLPTIIVTVFVNIFSFLFHFNPAFCHHNLKQIPNCNLNELFSQLLLCQAAVTEAGIEKMVTHSAECVIKGGANIQLK